MENEANHSEQIVPAATESTVEVAPAGPPEIRAGNLVVEGVIGGFDAYVFRPVAVASGTAPRLRARSFRVAAIGESIAQRVSERLGLRVLISTGSRFLLAGAAGSGWEETLNTLQREFDGWLFQHLQPPGMLQCWLAGAVCSDDRIPIRELEAHRAGRRLQPLEGALRIGPRWNGGAFVQAAGTNIGECSGCASVTSVHLFGDEHFCETCAADTEIGGRLPTYESAWLCEEREADIACPGGGGVRFSMPAAGGRELRLDQGPWPSLRRLPARDFAEMAGARKLLGFARLNVDGAAAAFEALAGDPGPTLVLAHAIHDYFAGQVLTGFPIYAGDDDVVLIGPWQPTLELAIELGKGFEKLSLSGGFTAVQPQSQVSAAVAQASENLDTARAAGGGRLRVFGETLEWKRAAQLLDTGRRVADWLDRRAISGPWLQRLAELRAFSNNGDSRWRARLAHLVTHTPIRHRQAREWALRLPGTVDHADSDWRWIRFLTRYASLAAPEAGAAEKSGGDSMGTMQDAFRKAGVEPPAATEAERPLSEPAAEKPCAKCGKTFRPARPQHRFCDECATAARADRSERPAIESGTAATGAQRSGPAEPAARPRPERQPERNAPGRGDRPARADAGPPRKHPGAQHARPPAYAGVEHRPPGPRGLPAHYLDTGYFSGGGALRPELLTDWAEQIAQGVAQGPAEPITQQLRLARNHVKRAVAALKYGRKPIGQVLNEIQRLKPFAAERAARRRLSDTFRQFVDANVERVTDEKSLLAFAEHFEAVAAYADGLLHSRRAGPTGPATQKERR